MLKKILALAIFSMGFANAATLTELLNIVQNELTDYEQQGLALEHPYVYTKLKNYYRYGKLYASYALETQAVELLSMASCSVAPLDCNPHKFLLRNMPINYFYLYKQKMPIVLANLETAYNAYAEWWIGENIKGGDIYKEYQNLGGILREDFYKAWQTFLTSVPKPVPFFITKRLQDNDLFLLAMLRVAYYNGWVKEIKFCGDKGDLIYLVQKGFLPPQTKFKYIPNKKPCAKIDLLWVY